MMRRRSQKPSRRRDDRCGLDELPEVMRMREWIAEEGAAKAQPVRVQRQSAAIEGRHNDKPANKYAGANYHGTISTSVLDGPNGNRYAQTAKKVRNADFHRAAPCAGGEGFGSRSASRPA